MRHMTTHFSLFYFIFYKKIYSIYKVIKQFFINIIIFPYFKIIAAVKIVSLNVCIKWIDQKETKETFFSKLERPNVDEIAGYKFE